MKYLIIFLLLPLLAYSQNQPTEKANKGASPVGTKTEQSKSGTTYAVVVGISDYQDKDIPDLRFADKDAEAFANYLRSPAGGSLDVDHLKILTNNQATLGQLAAAFDWLLEVAKEGDEAVIYFSGHGDVETKRLSQPGYLLGWDAPARNYMAGGAVNVRDFQDIVSTLSVTNKARVVVITDACHSGKLSGSEINGAQLTGQNLARQFANEVKILSCQPNEYSIEGEQWGGGRGAFSFNLVDALYGLADGNNDLSVTLQEVGRYLEDHVSVEVAPVSQVPMVLGNRSERLATVDAQLLSALRSGKTSQVQMLSPIETRGMEDDVLAGVDTTVRELYRLFKKALKDKVFLAPATACVDAYYERLVAEPKLARLHSTMRRNYAAALQDDGQQVLNTLLKTGLTDELLSAGKAVILYAQYPKYLQRAADLLGEGHYMYAPMQARKHFFEGKMATTAPEQQAAFHQALHWQPDMPHALAQMVVTFNAEQADSASWYFSKAAAQAPAWVVPYIFLANYYQSKAKQPGKAEELLTRAGQMDSASVYVWYGKANFYARQKNSKEAERWYLKAIAGAGTDICFPCAWNNLGVVYFDNGRYAEAEAAFEKAIQLDSTFVNACHNLGNVYFNTGRNAEAEAAYEKAIQLDSTFVNAWTSLGNVYFNTRRYAEAEAAYKKAIQLEPNNANNFNALGWYYLTMVRDYEAAEQQFLQSIALGTPHPYVFPNLGLVYAYQGYYAAADSLFRIGVALDPENEKYIMVNYAVLYSLQNNLEKAFEYLDKAFHLGYMETSDGSHIEMHREPGLLRMREQKERWFTLMRNSIVPDTTDAKAWLNFGALYVRTQRYNDAESILKKALALDATLAPAHYQLGRTYFKTNRPEDARREFQKTIELSPQARMARLGMAWLLLAEGKASDALDWVAQAIEKGGVPFDVLQSDEDLAPLRAQTDRWKTLMKKHFPNQFKD